MSAATSASASLLVRLLAAAPEDRPGLLATSAAPDGVLLQLADEVDARVAIDLPTALRAADLLIGLADAAGTAQERVRARRTACHARAYGGGLAEALGVAREAIGIAMDRGEVVEGARARLASLHPLCELGRIEEAIAEAETAGTALLAAGEPALAARARINLANIEKQRGAPERALAHLDVAREALVGEPSLMAHIENARGESLLMVDRFTEAEAAFSAALRFFDDGASFAGAVVRGNLADLCARQGRLPEALEHFESARRRLEKESSAGHLARLMIEQAEALESAGLPEDALAAYDEAIPRLVDVGLAFETARARLGRGRTLLRLRRFDAATPELEAAAEGFRALGHRMALARVDLIRGEHALRAGDLDRSESLLRGAAPGLVDRPIALAAAHFHLAQLAVARGDLDAAERLLDGAIEAATELEVATLLGDLLHARGRVHRLRGEIDEAVEVFSAAIETVERVRGAFRAERLRAAFLGERVQCYEDLVQAILDQRGPDAAERAFAIVERAKSRSLLELVQGAVDRYVFALERDEDPAARAMADEARRVQSELNALYSRIEDGGAQDQRRVDGTGWHRRIRRQEQELARIEQRIAMTERGATALATPVSVASVQAVLSAEGAVVEYFTANGELMAWVVRPGSAVLRRGLADVASVAERVAKLRFQLGRALRPRAFDGDTSGRRSARLLEDARRELHSLGALLVAPLDGDLDGVDRLVIVPHGSLHLVPFPALGCGTDDLVDRFEITTVPSASLFVHAARRGQRSAPERAVDSGLDGAVDDGTHRTEIELNESNELSARSNAPRFTSHAAVIGVSDHRAPLIDVEARAVAERIGAECLLLGAEATVDRVREAIAGARIVHFACHGRYSSSAPLASGLRMADRWMTVRDIASMRLAAELVCLSGCETGCTSISEGDELLGLLRGFLSAGAGAILATLWSSTDTSTTRLMTEFHGALQDATGHGAELRPAAALRAAQITLRTERPHPVFWAPFIITGAA